MKKINIDILKNKDIINNTVDDYETNYEYGNDDALLDEMLEEKNEDQEEGYDLKDEDADEDDQINDKDKE